MKDTPVVVRWENPPLDLKDPLQRFRRSEWNYFIADQKAKVLIGYWRAEDGAEEIGSSEFDELMHVIEGRLYVSCEGQEYVAGPGDTVVIPGGRMTRVAAREPVRALFVCYGVADPQGYDAMVRQMMAEKGL